MANLDNTGVERLGLVSTRLPQDGVRTVGMCAPVHAVVHVHTCLVLNERFQMCVHAWIRTRSRLVSNMFTPRFNPVHALF